MADRPEQTFRALKGQLKLDLSAPPAPNKAPVHQFQEQTTNQILNQILKSPEFEKISRDLAQSFQMATPTPTKLLNPQPWEVSNAQKQYAQGFLDALRSIQQMDNFKYDNNLASPSLFTPILAQQADLLASSPLLSPHNHRDMQSVLQSILPLAASSSQLTPVSAAPSVFGEEKVPSMQAPQIHTTQPSISLPSSSYSSLPTSLPSSLSSTLSSSLSSSFSSSFSNPLTSLPSAPSMPSQATTSLPMVDIKMEMPTRAVSEESDFSDRSSSTGPSRLMRGEGSELGLDDQDRRKLERKRLRNRMAASKCRQKKLERIADLEALVNEEKMRSNQLDSEMDQMRATLRRLQQFAALHAQKGCPQPNMMYKFNSV